MTIKAGKFGIDIFLQRRIKQGDWVLSYSMSFWNLHHNNWRSSLEKPSVRDKHHVSSVRRWHPARDTQSTTNNGEMPWSPSRPSNWMRAQGDIFSPRYLKWICGPVNGMVSPLYFSRRSITIQESLYFWIALIVHFDGDTLISNLSRYHFVIRSWLRAWDSEPLTNRISSANARYAMIFLAEQKPY